MTHLPKYIGTRLGQGIAVVFGAITVGYVLINVVGDPVAAMSTRQLTAEQQAALTQQYGLDQPLVPRFLHYLAGVARGDLGQSYVSEDSAAGLVLNALPKTGVLVAVALAAALLVAIPLAVLGVLRQGSLLDRLLERFVILTQGIPDFWLSLILVLVFAVQLSLLPSIDDGSPAAVVLPAAALALPLIATIMRIYRAELAQVLVPDFVAAMRLRGLGTAQIVWRHAVPNALAPLATFLALQLGWLMGGTLAVETIFGWQGIGALAVTATNQQNLPVLEALIIMMAVTFVLINLAADLAVYALDPRVRAAR
ncbi:ABC transporter permease [Dactylosporangium sucinum]|uniref:Peptide ABC transporter permease n=1 Tax=Dactylosporangium sucinum TaxID=1424081 RepID=A0A917X5J0_9ACTN|nr:ABC transporter permease [Dactylosporangium sucinum]GGM69768.1 peptide ABC transporter permease [Dactylosporangium sucinum]